ncbi:GNAT family N-acetyltransferase [Jeotgalibacillus sp. ET6]|uniref:GNAT family N-acetyltransferase n=1 Tax=Jeotgalibacillus sp. ET6 TaxID=3037260 RepID=UPI0024182085|nr:GNAT family N-acetyltransferase [Jeotgalibacillus sp. ET6]MDG5471905.1 GNAT family N-acetyltransferase [Jeotgalibacillus sp. ET6]
MYTVRSLKKEEFPFLREMLYESIYISPNKPPVDELLEKEGIKKYIENWGRQGDAVLLAVDEQNRPAGAIWHRVFSKEDPGYGFVDESIPEIGMAVIKQARGKGAGRALLDTMILSAQKQGYRGLSLSVDPENEPAVKLYEKAGFVKQGVSGTSVTMVRKLKIQ